VAPTGITTSGSFIVLIAGGATVSPTSVAFGAGTTSNITIATNAASGFTAGGGTGFYATGGTSTILGTGCEL
jgi:hypothetical protein